MADPHRLGGVLRSVAFYSAASFGTKVLGVLRALLLARLLPPEEFGVWVSLLLICELTPIASLGVVETLIKQVPYFLGRGDRARARQVEGGVLASLVLAGGGLGALAIAWAALPPGLGVPSPGAAVLLMAATGVASLFSAFFLHRFTAHQDFRMVSGVEMFRGAVTFVLVLAPAYRFGLTGAVAGYLLSELAVLAFASSRSVRMLGFPGLRFDRALLAGIVRIGFPIAIAWWVYVLQTTADRLMTISLLGKAAAGYFGLGVTMVGGVLLIPGVVAYVLYPRLNEVFGREADPASLMPLLITPLKGMILVLPLLIGGLMLSVPFVYSNILPDYVPGRESALVLLLASFFLCQVKNGANFLIAVDKQRDLLALVIASLALNLAAISFFIQVGWGITGVAFGTFLSSLALNTLVWNRTFQEFRLPAKARARALASLQSPFLALLGVYLLARSSWYGGAEIAVQAAVSLLFVAAYALAAWRIPPYSSWISQVVAEFGGRGGGTPPQLQH